VPTPRRKTLRDRGSKPLLLATLVVCSAITLGYLYSLVTAGNRPRPTGSFASLVDQDGRAFRDEAGSREYKLVVFGYTSCPEVCPTTLLKVHEVLNELGQPGAHLAPLFVTLDPAHDTLPVLARYTAHFDRRIVGITGDTREVRALAHAYGVYPPAPKPVDGSAYVDHSAMIFLLDRDNVLLEMYAPGVRARSIAADVIVRTRRQDDGPPATAART
jgi:protein SCO1/2